MKTKLFLLFAVVVMAVLGAQSASATVIPVPNGDFETAGDGYVAPALWANWQSNVVGARWWKDPRYGSTAPFEAETEPAEGVYNCAVMYQSGWVYADLTHVIQTDKDYTVSMDVRAGGTNQTGNLGIQLYAGAAHNIFLAQDFILDGDVSNTETWDTVTVNFSTTGGQNASAVGQILSIRIIQGDLAAVNEWAYVDNVQASYVPEPATLVLLGLGGLLLKRRRS